MITNRNTLLATKLEKLYKDRSADMLFHGWHHIYFVAKKTITFADEFDVDKELVEAAALTHDLNYLVEINSEPGAGEDLRAEYLTNVGFSTLEIDKIEAIVMSAHTATRHADISDEAKALSDADTLFKALPITPIIFAGHFITENQIDVKYLASKIVREQKPLMDQGVYFYTNIAKSKYLEWAEVNLALWENVQQALEDDDVKEMLAIAREFNAV